MARRRHQDGSKLVDVGDAWKLRYREYYIDPEGNQGSRRPTKYFYKSDYPTKPLLKRAVADFLQEVNKTSARPLRSDTFAQLAAKWQAQIGIHDKPSARDGSIIRVHLKPEFGDMPLRDIDAETVQAYISGHPAQPKTVENIVTTFRRIWKTAKAWGYVTHNPFEGLVLPKKGAPKTHAFTLEETLAIIDKAKEPWKTLIWIAAETGIRSGELAGLRIQDYDPAEKTITVSQASWNAKIQTPKTANAIRRAPIGPRLCAAVEGVIASLEGKKNPHGLLFPSQSGEPMYMSHFINRVFRPILKELGIYGKVENLGITKCGLHALRRMSATQMDGQHVPLRTQQDRLGHAHPSTTLIHYTKPIDEASRAFSDRMDALLSTDREGATQ